ncbi:MULTISPECIES: transcription antitermination factor NusB [unclassified Kaistella]|uniref:transcription antitermination factor NusB n=1 Tax=unclassified Kaistella TaxID=2762626 RepID=UPI0027349342|nr:MULTISPECIES: transcription antitermination factor NusB [unclassified Kaistella]MCZ2082989.1 transcription antitermination factor NusB [Flavobacteriales bacterium]MDP2452681.1 transcription antitermination factor NusB [Kaistella sp. SH11-4b]MDP2455590.1 transcription antitermination factor NusB [Kaistella sp. SH40-3]MDP2458494.1 transcription antitermination factor NusB [Kaistella sp. SH19-2b]
MLGRRQIREKVVESLYSYYQNPIKFDILEKNMFSEIDKIYHLYIYQLNFLVALKDLAERQIEIGKNKYIQTDKEINPNQKFINNQILIKLEENEERLSFTSKNQDLKWDLYDDLLVKTFQRMSAGKRYQDFMKEEGHSFEADQKFIGKLFLRYIAENEDFHEHLEEKELSWADDFHISNSMIQKTIGFFKENQPSHTLIKMIKDEEDREFARKLLKESLNHWDENEKKLEGRLDNWDLDRVALIDKIILIAAISELDYFPLTPARVIINEYIEIAKVFSTDRSNIFINGILDKYTKDLNRS